MEERELNELRYLKKEIRYQMERVRRLEEKATSVTQIIGGIPACKGITDRVAEYAPQIASMKTLIQKQHPMVFASPIQDRGVYRID